jgi:hypothetical protein
VVTKRGLEKEERDDEEEWGRIPIPQSDDSDSTDEWLSEEPDKYESTSTDEQDRNKKGYLNCFMAFLIAPRKDGRALTKDGKIIDVNDCSTTKEEQSEVTLPEDLPDTVQLVTRPYWTQHLFAYQRQQLRKGYRKKDRSKVMMKLIRQIQRYHQNKLKNSSGTTTHGRQPIFHTLLPQQFDAELGFINRPNTLRQCMNAVSPCQTSKHKLSPVKTSNTDSYAKKSRNTFSPIVIPGTPEATIPDLQEEKSSDTGAEQEWAYHDDDTRELENLDLCYKIFNMNRPEPGESNSEAAARHQAINDEYEHLLEMQRWDKQDKAKLTKHELTPSLPLGSSVHFRSLDSYSSLSHHSILNSDN